MAKLNTSVTLSSVLAGGSEGLFRHGDAQLASAVSPDKKGFPSAAVVSVPAWARALRALCGLAVVMGLVQDVTAQSPAGSVSSDATPKAAPVIAPAPRIPSRLVALPRTASLATIRGNAVDMAKAAVPNAPVRLRDARLGRIVGSQMTDKEGKFSFQSVEPGSYVAEIVDENRSVLASSQLIGANAGEQAVVLLKLPASLLQIGRFIGSTTSSNPALEAQAAAAGGVGAMRPGTPISER